MRYAHPLIITLFSVLPYAVVAWGYTKLTDGDTTTFWITLGVLFAIRLFFLTIESLGHVVSLRLHRRQIAVNSALKFLKANGFPPRKFADDNLWNYLARIHNDPECPDALRKSAAGIEHALALIEEFSILMGAHAHEA